MNKINLFIKKLNSTGFYTVFLSGVVNKIVNFAYGVVLVRVISKASYGVYSYANNIYCYFALFLGIGAAGTLLQLCSEDGDNLKRKKDHQECCFSISWYFNLVLSLFVILFSIVIKMPIEGSNYLLLWMGMLPCFTQFTPLYLSLMRSNFDNKNYSLMSVINSVFIFGLSVLGAWLFGSVGVVVGRYIAEILTVMIIHMGIKIPVVKVLKYRKMFSGTGFVQTVKLGVTICISESLVQVISLVGTSTLGVLLKNDEVIASYKVASTIPNALSFVASAIMVYAYPYFAKNRNDYLWTRKAYRLLIGGIAMISLVIGLGCSAFSNQIIRTLFGIQYSDCVSLFRILIIGYILNSILRIPAANLILSQWKMKASTIISIIGLAVTVAINFLLISRYGSDGAAYAQCISMVLVGSICSVYYILVIKGGDKNAQKIN